MEMEIHFGWSWKVMENDFPKRVVTLVTLSSSILCCDILNGLIVNHVKDMYLCM